MPSLLSLGSAVNLARAVGWPVDALFDSGLRRLLIAYEGMPPACRSATVAMAVEFERRARRP